MAQDLKPIKNMIKKIALCIFLGTIIFVSGCNRKPSFAKPSFAITIESMPLSAVIYIDEEYKGKTPLNIELKTGEHNLILLKEGYIALKEKITVNRDDSLFHFTLKNIPIKEALPFSGSIGATIFSNQRIIIAEYLAGSTKLHCIDTSSDNELWSYTIEGLLDVSLKITDNLLFAFSETQSPPSLYIFDINGRLLYSYKNISFKLLGDYLDRDIALTYDYSSQNYDSTSIWCYSFSSRKIIWKIDIKKGILVPVDPDSKFVFVFGMNENFVTLYKLDKSNGKVIYEYNLKNVRGSVSLETGRITPTIVGILQSKVLLLSGNSMIYCIDLNTGKICFNVEVGFQPTAWEFTDEYLAISSNSEVALINLESGRIIGNYNTSFRRLPKYLAPSPQVAIDVINRKIFISGTDGKIHLYSMEGKEIVFKYATFIPSFNKNSDYASLKIESGILFAEIHYVNSVENEIETIAYNAKTLEPILNIDHKIYAKDNCIVYRVSSENKLIFMNIENIK